MQKEKELKVQLNCDVPALWLDHKDGLWRFIRKRVVDDETANDISQEVLMKVYKFCMTKSGIHNVRSWLFQIAKNTIIDYQRKSNRISYELPDLSEEEEDKTYQEAAAFILPMIEFLPEKYAAPLRLSDIEGMKQAAIARKLGLSLSGAKSRIQRARQLLKEEFITCCNFETDSQGNLTSFSIKADCIPLQKLVDPD